MGQAAEQRVLGGRYHLDEVLGVGGMSVVWRARDEVLARNVAIKLLSGRYLADAGSRLRIRVEARAAAALAHPNVAHVHDFGETVEDGQRIPYIVMELVPGPTLAQRAAAERLPAATVFRICAEVAAGLAAAHADGLVHRDVKPANVILAPTGAKVVDFGIAAAADPGGPPADEDDPDVVFGTPTYLAPERITNGAVTPASDVYSLGVMLYKLLADRLPWEAAGTEVLRAHLHAAPAPLPPRDDVPPRVAELCLRCLAKDPADRPAAAEVARVLNEPVAAPRRRRRALLAAALGATVAAAVAAVLVGHVIPASDRSGPDRAQPGATAATGPAAAQPPGLPAGTPTGPVRSTPSAATRSSAADATRPGAAPGAPGPVGATGAGATTAAPVAPTAAPASPSAPGAGPATTFTSAGGTVDARCTGAGLAELVSWASIKPYKTDRIDPGPAATAAAAFRHGNQTVDMTVRCNGTTPTETTTTG
jgi:eukaryotic-like serine/threonine-protein kinase